MSDIKGVVVKYVVDDAIISESYEDGISWGVLESGNLGIRNKDDSLIAEYASGSWNSVFLDN